MLIQVTLRKRKNSFGAVELSPNNVSYRVDGEKFPDIHSEYPFLKVKLHIMEKVEMLEVNFIHLNRRPPNTLVGVVQKTSKQVLCLC